MQKDELFHGQYAAEYYDKLMSGEGEAGYLHTKDSYRHIAQTLCERMRGLKPDGDSLLEVGCGTGNFCVEFARLGLRVKGTDYSEDLLLAAKQKRHRNLIGYEYADMRDFSEPEPFDYLVCLFDTFRYNQSFREVKQTLRCFYQALKSGGVLVLDAHYTNPVRKERRIELPAVHMSDGTVVKETVFTYTRDSQDIKRSVHDIYQDGCFVERKTVQRLPRIRISPLKMRRFLQAAGFGSVQLLSGYDNQGKPEKLVAVAVRQ